METHFKLHDASSGSDYRVDVTLNQPLTAGNSVWFTVTTNVAGMISNDTQNPGNFGMQFIPQWTEMFRSMMCVCKLFCRQM